MRSIFSLHKGVFFGVVLILVVILIVLTKMAFSPTNKIPTKATPTPAPTPKIVGLCAPFPTDKGEISCEEAKKIALEKYPGKIIHIDLGEEKISTATGTLPKVTITVLQKKVWLLTINLKDPLLSKSIKQSNGKAVSTETKTSVIKVRIDKILGKILFIEQESNNSKE